MSEPMLEKLNEAERTCVDHLRQAQVLGVSLAEYCRSFDLDLAKWYRVKQALARKGMTVTATSVAVAEVSNVDPAAEEKAAPFARVQIAAVPAAPVYQWPGIRGTVNFGHIKRHYYQSHETINPTRIVPIGPLNDFEQAHGRDGNAV